MTDVAKKLLIKAGQTVRVFPPQGAAMPSLGEMPEGVTPMEEAAETADVVLLFVTSRTEQESRQMDAIAATRPGGLFWICYPKKTSGLQSDLSREVVWQTAQPTGWRPVTQIAIDEIWSAMRMRPESDVVSRSR